MVEERVRKGNFILKVSIERSDSRLREEFAELPNDLPFKLLAQYDPNTGVTTVDIKATKIYAKWAAVRETLAGNGSKYFGECTENNFQLSDQPVERRKSIEYLLVNRIVPNKYKERYVRQTIEFYELMLSMAAYDQEISPEIVESFRAAETWLKSWLTDRRFTVNPS